MGCYRALVTALLRFRFIFTACFMCHTGFRVAICGTLAAAPWLRWRFSLRTLLIATTLVAVVLGVIVVSSRSRGAFSCAVEYSAKGSGPSCLKQCLRIAVDRCWMCRSAAIWLVAAFAFRSLRIRLSLAAGDCQMYLDILSLGCITWIAVAAITRLFGLLLIAACHRNKTS